MSCKSCASDIGDPLLWISLNFERLTAQQHSPTLPVCDKANATVALQDKNRPYPAVMLKVNKVTHL